MDEKITAEIKRSSKAEDILAQINSKTKLGDLRKIAKEIKKDHELALELWSTEAFLPRLLAILIMDKKLLSEDVLNKLDEDMQIHTFDERNNLMDWLMANQLTKDKKRIALMQSWENSPRALQRRAFWYYQARLRWTGQAPPDNTAELLAALEANIMQEEPEVQWAMNFTAGWIGIYDEKNRTRCMKLGEKTGLYKDEIVAKGCTPSYLPEFITIEINKRHHI
ncbi:DNA alkylation repair protein [Oceanobacillus oncorhynchi subsp. incaldanensis]|uniref:DNA alkylation repair protein n=1 Tax=Oceanobacillus oncorhynchi TaxID=545501 RepID=UPI001B23C354|nr:DNA alkylation repair protein [Oceanobacillus oncorhynchi]GIO17266.1 DNA alkylation repair protein [Oceanobacillus oncorhynchi subsp. incaldanensis]